MNKWLIMLITGLTLGLGWAIRGHFGHWWGASWAGGMGTLALLLAVGRKDWILRAPVLTLLAAVGWGIGGIMSYGILVGYCRSTDLFNSAYGYFSLFVVGGLYGFIGGGLLGLGMASENIKKPDWFRVLIEMFIIGALAYWIIIIEMEWTMTPPRDESWAYCMGAALALGWYQFRMGKINALRVALFSGLGGGVGFAVGNFIQTLGAVSGISYNWWNVMEFTLGLFGGIGMAYGVLSSKWTEENEPNSRANWLTLIALVFVIPAINIFQSFDSKKILQLAELKGITDGMSFFGAIQILVWSLLIVFTLFSFITWQKISSDSEVRKNGIILFSLYSLLYTAYGVIRTGFFYSDSIIGNSVLTYWILLPVIIILLFYNRERIYEFKNEIFELETWQFWTKITLALVVLFFILALISIGSHDGIPGSHDRF